MDIVTISDPHGHQPKLPKGDLLLSAGDISMLGRYSEVKKHVNWLKSKKQRYKMGIVETCGNHDFLFEDWREGLPKTKRGVELERNFAQAKKLYEDAGIHLLMDEEIIINGIKIYGSPASPEFHNWAFNYQRGEIGEKVWSKIPNDVQILITHGPPYGLGDLCRGGHVGCQALLERIKNLPDLKLHIFGHIHEGAGHYWFQNKLFVNASVLDEYYNGFNDIQIIEWPNLKIRRFPDEYV